MNKINLLKVRTQFIFLLKSSACVYVFRGVAYYKQNRVSVYLGQDASVDILAHIN